MSMREETKASRNDKKVELTCIIIIAGQDVARNTANCIFLFMYACLYLSQNSGNIITFISFSELFLFFNLTTLFFRKKSYLNI